MAKVYLSLGSNIGNKLDNIKSAYIFLEKAGVEIIKKSKFYFSEPYGSAKLNDFVNSVIEVCTDFPPKKLLLLCQNIENRLGRKKINPDIYENRPIDIDILFYDDEIICEDGLNIPHYDLENRDFVLSPMAEIAPDKILSSGKTVKEALASISDKTRVLDND